MALQMPEHISERAHALLNGGYWQPPVARDATTVVLVRDGEPGLEVCVLRRSEALPFAPGVCVFPGGALDPADFDVPVTGQVRATLPSVAPALASALLVAGVRETFEEVGVLLAVSAGDAEVVADADWPADRAVAAAGSLAAVLARRSLQIVAEDLLPIAHWVTPEVESRRYDTRFLLAELPPEQRVDVDGSEIVDAVWVTPAHGLVGADSGELPMLPPTRAVIAMLASVGTVADAFALARATQIRPLMPAPVKVGDDIGWVLTDAYTGARLGEINMPAGSEVEGAN